MKRSSDLWKFGSIANCCTTTETVYGLLLGEGMYIEGNRNTLVRKQHLLKLSVSIQTVGGCVSGLTEGVQYQLREKVKNFLTCSATSDASTDITNMTEPDAFVRGVNVSHSGATSRTGTHEAKNRY